MIAPWKDYDFKNKKQYCLTLYRQIKRYCKNPKSKFYYIFGKQGIKCDFTSSIEIEYLYNRDQVDQMKKPKFIRKNDEKNFMRDNCLFVENEVYREALYRLSFKMMERKSKKRTKIWLNAIKHVAAKQK